MDLPVFKAQGWKKLASYLCYKTEQFYWQEASKQGNYLILTTCTINLWLSLRYYNTSRNMINFHKNKPVKH